MSKKAKLYQRILSKPKDLRFSDLEQVLIDCGFILRSKTGDHFVYKRPGSRPIVIPHKQPVKSYLIDQVMSVVEEYLEEYLQDN